jgi:ribonuclease-3
VNWLKSLNPKKGNRSIRKSIKNIFGFTPKNSKPYELALRHSSVAVEIKEGVKESNERLEFLGDAILSAVVAEYLFIKFPYKDEGFLTEIRSRIVSRVSLNKLAVKLGIDQIMEYDPNNKSQKSIAGNCFEALIGAIFIDKGYKFVKKLLINSIFNRHIDIDEIINSDGNFKSKLINWAQAEKKEVKFDTEEVINGVNRHFITKIIVDNIEISSGNGLSKKSAEQHAAENACKLLIS